MNDLHTRLLIGLHIFTALVINSTFPSDSLSHTPLTCTMANPVVTIDHLGPYDPKDVSDEMLTMVMGRDGPPIILKQDAPTHGGGMRPAYAVLMNKDVRIACVHCFRRDMRVTDSTRVKTCASFVKHWCNKEGKRLMGCKDDGDVNFMDAICTEVIVDATPKVPEPMTDEELMAEVGKRGLKTTMTDEELLEEVEERGINPEFTKHHACGLSDDDLAYVFETKGIKPLIDARPNRLIHELKRQSTNTLTEDYYAADKKEGKPHCSEPCGAALVVPDVTVTRSKRKREAVVARYEPKPYNDLS